MSMKYMYIFISDMIDIAGQTINNKKHPEGATLRIV